MSVFTKLFNKLGYDSLSTQFSGGPEPQGQRWERTCAMFGGVQYKWCVTVVVAQDGLWLQAKPPLQGDQAPIFLPWREIQQAQPATLYWQKAVRLVCGRTEMANLTLWQSIWRIAEPYWRAARASA